MRFLRGVDRWTRFRTKISGYTYLVNVNIVKVVSWILLVVTQTGSCVAFAAYPHMHNLMRRRYLKLRIAMTTTWLSTSVAERVWLIGILLANRMQSPSSEQRLEDGSSVLMKGGGGWVVV